MIILKVCKIWNPDITLENSTLKEGKFYFFTKKEVVVGILRECEKNIALKYV